MATYTSGAINEVLIGTGVLYLADRTASGLAFPADNSGAFQTASEASSEWRDIDILKMVGPLKWIEHLRTSLLQKK